MALTIVVRSTTSGERPQVTLDSPRVVLGRGDGCEIKLPDPSVSHRHASIRQRGTDYILLDEGSTNGTFVGGVQLSPHAPRILKSGELVRVGKVWLEIIIEQAPPTQELQVATKEIALKLVQDALSAQGDTLLLTVTVDEGPDRGAELILTEFDKSYVLGRGSGTDLKLSDEDASRRHVALRRRGDRVQATDLGSKNGTLLGEAKLEADAAREWQPGVPLKIGGNVLSYRDPLAEALSELEHASDEPLSGEDYPLLESPTPGGVAPSDEPASEVPLQDRGASPIEALPKTKRRRSHGPRPASTDVLVAFAALCVLALSGLGLFWLFGTE